MKEIRKDVLGDEELQARVEALEQQRRSMHEAHENRGELIDDEDLGKRAEALEQQRRSIHKGGRHE